jgi:hypothetical protein
VGKGDAETRADGEGDADPDALAAADPDALAAADPEAPAAADPDALADPLASGAALRLGDGKSELGRFTNERAKISTKMTSTTTTHARARLSLRGGSEPR